MSLSVEFYTVVVLGPDSKPTTKSGETFYLVSGQPYSIMFFNHNPKFMADVEVFVAGQMRDTFVLSPDRGVKLQGQFNSPCEIAVLFQLKDCLTEETVSGSWWWNLWKKSLSRPVEPVVLIFNLAAKDKKK